MSEASTATDRSMTRKFLSVREADHARLDVIAKKLRMTKTSAFSLILDAVEQDGEHALVAAFQQHLK